MKFKKPKKVAFINGKGGCGKSTSIFHVAGELSKRGDKVLVLDLDKQHNTTDTFLKNLAIEHIEIEKTMFDIMTADASFESVVKKTFVPFRTNANPKYVGIDVVPSDSRFETEEHMLLNVDIQHKLDLFVKQNKYDWVLVDMPPSHKKLNDICFQQIAEYVIVPFSSDLHSVTGYGDLMETINHARILNPSLKILGVFLARYMGYCEVDKYIRNQLLPLKDMFIDIQIPLRADIREAVMFGKPIAYYRPSSKSAEAFSNLVGEMVRRIDKY